MLVRIFEMTRAFQTVILPKTIECLLHNRELDFQIRKTYCITYAFSPTSYADTFRKSSEIFIPRLRNALLYKDVIRKGKIVFSSVYYGRKFCVLKKAGRFCLIRI